MTGLLDRVRSERQRRSEPHPELLDFLRWDELEDLRGVLRRSVDGEPLDTALLARLERRARVRRKLGLRLRDQDDPSFKPDSATRPCAHPTFGDCRCTDEAIDTRRRIATRKGLLHATRQIHARRYPPTKPEQPERRPLAKVFAFRRPEPPDEPLPAALTTQVVAAATTPTEREELDPILRDRPLLSVPQLADFLGVRLMATATREDE